MIFDKFFFLIIKFQIIISTTCVKHFVMKCYYKPSYYKYLKTSILNTCKRFSKWLSDINGILYFKIRFTLCDSKILILIWLSGSQCILNAIITYSTCRLWLKRRFNYVVSWRTRIRHIIDRASFVPFAPTPTCFR